jgi:hypothetical protein
MTDHKQNAGPYPHGTFASAAWALGTATRALGRQLELAIRAFGREVAAPLLPAARAFVCRRYGHDASGTTRGPTVPEPLIVTSEHNARVARHAAAAERVRIAAALAAADCTTSANGPCWPSHGEGCNRCNFEAAAAFVRGGLANE